MPSRLRRERRQARPRVQLVQVARGRRRARQRRARDAVDRLPQPARVLEVLGARVRAGGEPGDGEPAVEVGGLTENLDGAGWRSRIVASRSSAGATRVGFKVESTEAQGASLVEFAAAPGFDTGVHEFEFRAGDETFHAFPGACVFVPPQVPHAFANRTDAPAKLLLVMAPPTHDRYFDELGEILAADGPPDGAAIGALRERYDTKQLSTLTGGRAR